jgi:LPS sulfotransferase NodH
MSPTPSLFHHLRRARALMVGVLAWWAVSLAAAVITPALAADPVDAPLHQICSALGVQPPADQNTAPPAEPPHVGWHCVLCLGGAALVSAAPAPLPHVDSAISFTRAAATPAPHSRYAGPAPARGPPAA